MKYADIVIDNNNDKTDRFYTYRCGLENAAVGDKVSVPFARGKKLRDGYIFRISDREPEHRGPLKQVEAVREGYAFTEEMVETCLWMKKRYLCRYIEAVRCFAPAGTPSKRGRSRLPDHGERWELPAVSELTPEQAAALEEIGPFLERREHQTFLLHGVTGSGKTEVYLRLIEKTAAAGRTAIMMVPEISLTKQIIDRFTARFGRDAVAVLHSRLSAGQRHDEWLRIRRGEVSVVIGARSAVFAPLENIGAVILDEEHEGTYKSDKNPKYETVEVALKRARAHGGVLVLGSATPSVVTSVRAEEGLYRKISLKERYNRNPLPEVEIVDMRKELKDGNLSVFSRSLCSRMEATLARGSQVILFLNRRGYAAAVTCRDCGYTGLCPVCGISLTYHKKKAALLCHYCGRREPFPESCPQCGSRRMRPLGTGTEKIEEAVAALFPEIPAARLDLDTIRTKGSLEKILQDFRKGRSRILIGTQLVAKGLDFAGVGLVGILAADITLNIPDFKSAERTFQLITQAAGRTGRGEEEGFVVVQTYNPGHYAVAYGAAQDYEGFFRMEKGIRKQLEYPPYSDIIQLLFTGEEEADAEKEAREAWEFLRERLKRENGFTVFPPQPGPAGRQAEHFRFQIVVKALRGSRGRYTAALEELRRQRTVREEAAGRKEAARIPVMTLDINPYSF